MKNKKEVLEIKKEAAITAHENTDKKGKHLLEDLLGKRVFQKGVMECIKSFDDAINELGESDIEVIEYKKLLSVNSAEHILGNQQAVIITKALNEDWAPDWDNSSEYKYTPWFNMGSSGSDFSYCDYGRWSAASFVGSRLCFKSSELAQYAGEQFTEVYKKFMLIN